MAKYCVKCGKAIKDSTPGNDLYCRECSADGRKDILLLTDDPEIISAYGDAADKTASEDETIILTLPPEQQNRPEPPRNNNRNDAGAQQKRPPAPQNYRNDAGAQRKQPPAPRNDRNGDVTQRIQPPAPRIDQNGGYNAAVGPGPSYQPPYSYPAPPKKNNSKSIVIIAAVVLVIAAAAAALFFILRNEKDHSDDSAATTLYVTATESMSETEEESFSFTDLINIDEESFSFTDLINIDEPISFTNMIEITDVQTTAAVITTAPAETTTVGIIELDTPSFFELYKSTIAAFGETRVERAADLGYTIDYPAYGYEIKDINNDDTDELIILDQENNDILAIYSLDGETPVEIYFIGRHGGCGVTADGYIVETYKSATLKVLLGTNLITIAESDRLESDADLDIFLMENGASPDRMQFTCTPWNG
ncbi:MAG: hypothetical protein K6G90_07475 [Clostridia bacterium]|nr:hypothetical protein [Clostridia bacterium]